MIFSNRNWKKIFVLGLTSGAVKNLKNLSITLKSISNKATISSVEIYVIIGVFVIIGVLMFVRRR